MKRLAPDELPLPLAITDASMHSSRMSAVPASPARPHVPGSAPIRTLLEALDHAQIRYCHWKSNVRLLESLAGDGDLDLLVHRQDAAVFTAVLLESGFKLAGSATGIGHPGVLHAFALDPDRAALLHVHFYFQIVTGDSLAKSYRPPLEDMLLAGTRRLHGVPVPSAEAELVSFMLRIALKHASLVELVMVNRHYLAVIHELDWLRDSASAAEAAKLWRRLLPDAPVSSFRDFQDAIADQRNLLRRARLSWKISRHLQNLRRLAPIAAMASRLWRVLMLALGRLRRRRGLVPTTSGIIVAFVGPKATGKSTLTATVARRLGRHYRVRQVHVGKPPATPLTLLPRLMLPLGRRLWAGQRSRELEGPKAPGGSRFSFVYVLRQAILAYERRALVRRCWRDAASGSIVIADRYPSASPGATDSSHFEEADVARCKSRIKRWLMSWERRLYSGLPGPGLVIRLSAPIQTTLRRDAERDKTGGPNPTAVTRRRHSESVAEFPDARVVTIDTDRSLDETVSEAMRAVWTGN
jgi:thymidylate kinase